MSRKNIVISFALTTVVLVILILFGPASAFILSLDLKNGGTFVQGEKVEYEVSAEIEEGEVQDIKSFRLSFIGPDSFSCDFLPNGTLISSCPNVNIKQIQQAPYGFEFGYGYGFMKGKLKYKIILDSNLLELGQYESRLLAIIGGDNVESGDVRVINIAEGDLLNSCSLRAKDGGAVYNGQALSSKNRLSLFVPTADATRGHGSLTLQNRRDRVSYTFDVEKARIVVGGKKIFDVSGILRKGTNQSSGVREKAQITFNENTFEISVDGKNIDVTDMDVYFVKC